MIIIRYFVSIILYMALLPTVYVVAPFLSLFTRPDLGERNSTAGDGSRVSMIIPLKGTELGSLNTVPSPTSLVGGKSKEISSPK